MQTKERKRYVLYEEFINDIKDLNDYYAFRDRDLSNIDLSNLVLGSSDIYMENCDLSNTNIRMNFNSYNKFINCDLRSCKFNIDDKDLFKYNAFSFYSCILDKEQIEYLNRICKKDNTKFYYNLDTILNNDGIYINSCDLLRLIYDYLRRNKYDRKIFSEEELKEVVDFIELCISKDSGCLKKIYDILKEQMNPYDIIDMFAKKIIRDKKISNLVFDKDMYKLFKEFNIIRCDLDNIVYDVDSEELLDSDFNLKTHIYNNVSNISFPNFTVDDYLYVRDNRLNMTPYTFRKNLYLELGRQCNGKCKFCRNNCFEDSKYNYDAIVNNLKKIIKDLDSVVIGGGEPTLKKELVEFLKEFTSDIKKIYLFSNGSKSNEYYVDLLDKTKNVDYMGMYISRHSYDDKENAMILGIDEDKLLLPKEYSKFQNFTMSCTCFKGGMDSLKKIIEYLNFARDNYVENVLLCNLQDDTSVQMVENLNEGLNIDDSLFDNVIDYLKRQNFKMEIPIVSTGGYILYILKREGFTVTLKKYLKQEEFIKLWPKAIKRTFDFSMAPSGDIYSNWSEVGEKVKELRYKWIL